ncbi:hypothetical protein F4779DRAFT_614498 [Xylariaceae sp. FL0662B]|nr:hypothetical protein F4779DRAFT_614498 [Xylariaceae sp. FL0662B]
MSSAPIEFAASKAQGPVNAMLRQAASGLRQASKVSEASSTAIPAYVKPQRGDWGKIAKNRAGTAVVYFSGLAAAFSWPFWTKPLLDGHIGQL